MTNPIPINTPFQQSWNHAYHARAAVRRWLMLAVASLLMAGMLSLTLIIGRMPPFSQWLTDPLFFKRALVVHVDLALIVWFYAFGAALFLLLPAPGKSRIAHIGGGIATLGVTLMVASAGITGVVPILANYVPVLDHPLFLTGLSMFAIGLTLALANSRLLKRPTDADLQNHWFDLGHATFHGLRAMAALIALALLTLVISWFNTPSGLDAPAYYEVLFWGPGHILQVAGVTMMLSVWMILLRGVLNKDIIPEQFSKYLFTGLVIPQLAGPWLALQGTTSTIYRDGFTKLMQFGIFPLVTIFLTVCLLKIVHAYRHDHPGKRWFLDPRLVGFLASAALTIMGFILGAMIRGSNTMIPAHYHAALGAITIALMTVSFVLFEPLGLRLSGRRLQRLARIQPLIFGAGQVIFSLGFAIAGANGMGRKAYASEQAIRSTGEYLGLVVMGTGGLLAVAGGLLFLALFLAALGPHIHQTVSQIRSFLWKTHQRIPSKN